MHDSKRTVAVLKKFPNFKFSIETPKGRGQLRKFIYLLQVFGVNLEYEYQWPASNPSSKVLDENMSDISKRYNKPQGTNLDHAYDSNLENFRMCVKDRESDDNFITVVASLHWLRNNSSCTNDEIIQTVTTRSGFTEEQVCTVLKELRQWDKVDMIFGVKNGGKFLNAHSILCEKYEDDSTDQ